MRLLSSAVAECMKFSLLHLASCEDWWKVMDTAPDGARHLLCGSFELKALYAGWYKTTLVRCADALAVDYFPVNEELNPRCSSLLSAD